MMSAEKSRSNIAASAAKFLEFWKQGRHSVWTLAASTVFILIWLLFRNLGLQTFFEIETEYSRLARLQPLSKAPLNHFLYLQLMSVTNFCGHGFLECARLLNGLFFAASAPLIYRIARKVCDPYASVLVVILSLAASVNSITAYMKPEAIFYFFFWLVTWFFLEFCEDFLFPLWFAGGLLIGIASLIKPDILFILPVLVVFQYFSLARHSRQPFLLSLQNFLAIAGGILLIRWGIRSVLTDEQNTGLWGIPDSFHLSFIRERGFEFMKVLGFQFKDPIFFLCFTWGLPVVIALDHLISFFQARNRGTPHIQISSFAVLVWIGLSFVMSFLATFSDAPFPIPPLFFDPQILWPMLAMILIGSLSQPERPATFPRYLLALPVLLAAVWTIYQKISSSNSTFLNFPEMRSLWLHPISFWLLGGLSIFSMVLWIFSPLRGLKLSAFLAMPLFFLVPSFYSQAELRLRLNPDRYDRAIQFASQVLPPGLRAKLLIIGSEEGAIVRSLFHLDQKQVNFQVVPEGSALDLKKISLDHEWVLIIGHYPILKDPSFQLAQDGFRLVHPGLDLKLEFDRASWMEYGTTSMGFGDPEEWGTWSVGPKVEIKLTQDLPTKFKISLLAHAFGPNAGAKFRLQIGDQSREFRLEKENRWQDLDFNLHQKARTLSIEIPIPTSPASLGLGTDSRLLGIGLTELRILPANEGI